MSNQTDGGTMKAKLLVVLKSPTFVGSTVAVVGSAATIFVSQEWISSTLAAGIAGLAGLFVPPAVGLMIVLMSGSKQNAAAKHAVAAATRAHADATVELAHATRESGAVRAAAVRAQTTALKPKAIPAVQVGMVEPKAPRPARARAPRTK